jgi:hypothetical protein
MRHYLSHEGALFISQGCVYDCAFCGAEKGQREQFKNLDMFTDDLESLAYRAEELGIKKLEFYATSLDFFQNPRTIEKYLQAVIDVKKKTGIEIRIRCLSCMKSFLNADRVIQNLKELLEESGLWCIGFGIDGTDETIWKAQNKTQNKEVDVIKCLDMCEDYGVTAEALLIMGFPQDTVHTLWKNIVNSFRYIRTYPHVILRPYLAKVSIPGNEQWETDNNYTEKFITNPNLFYNLDFCMIGSSLTHPKLWHRMISNASYLVICGVFIIWNRCAAYPLMSYGENKLWNIFAKWWNSVVPFDE